ncbi:MAG: hypothetical protein KDA41_03785 [Planctomycetales bacterium]|nr:hypothetical protein [Planctomycetales bacterium]
MKFAWSVRLPVSRLDALGHIRLAAGVQILVVSDTIWLAGESCDEELTCALAALPEAQRFLVLSDGQVARHGERVPCDALPQGEWKRLRDEMRIRLPTEALSAGLPSPVSIQLVRGGAPAPPNVLVTTGARWLEYAATAPQVRLRQWSFAVDDCEGVVRVVVRGAPSPPMSGSSYVERHGVASPVGYAWDPPVAPEVIREKLRLADSELVLLATDGTHERIAADRFVQATRSAARLSLSFADAKSGA